MKIKATQINIKDDIAIVVCEPIDQIFNSLRHEGWAYVQEINGKRYIISDNGFKYMFECSVDDE